MYKIGDKVLYPMHGAGVIEGIEERDIVGEKHNYYTMRVPVGDMKVLIPCEGTENTGLRSIIDEKTADKVILSMEKEEDEELVSWNKRYRDNLLRIKSGNIFEVAAVVRSLMVRDREKGLSTGERKMMMDARHILISELVLAKNMDKEEITEIIEKKVFGNT
ncbi:MAG: CarD family transcriptional regulator [Clostridia bacterium]|nr:CarD family transcriptional regulator [Clostridia bacterium]